MKLWEVLKALDENPNKRFMTDLGSVIAFKDGVLEWEKFEWEKTDGVTIEPTFIIYDKRTSHFIDSASNVEDIWQEVKQPVTWQEALEAWVNGKSIRWEDREEVVTINGYQQLLDDDKGPLAKYQITTGTWYIED